MHEVRLDTGGGSRRRAWHRRRDAAALVASAEPAIRVVADDPDRGEVCLPDEDLGLILAACR